MIHLRPSSMDRALACPASLAIPDGEVQVGGDDDLARLGTAYHAYIGEYVASGSPVAPKQLAEQHHVDEDDLSVLCHFGRECWSQIGGEFPNPLVEHEFIYVDEAAGVTIKGHPDIVSIVGEQARIPDWKTGYNDGDHDEQLRSYGFLVCKEFPEIKTVLAAKVRIRDMEIDDVLFTRQELERWWVGAVERIKARDEYNPGIHCGYCPRGATCPGKQAVLKQSAAIISTQTGDMTPTR